MYIHQLFAKYSYSNVTSANGWSHSSSEQMSIWTAGLKIIILLMKFGSLIQLILQVFPGISYLLITKVEFVRVHTNKQCKLQLSQIVLNQEKTDKWGTIGQSCFICSEPSACLKIHFTTLCYCFAKTFSSDPCWQGCARETESACSSACCAVRC